VRHFAFAFGITFAFGIKGSQYFLLKRRRMTIPKEVRGQVHIRRRPLKAFL
jgi:hypothetical protein